MKLNFTFAIIDYIKNDGIKNTFEFSSRLFTKGEVTSTVTDGTIVPGICQIDFNNFVFFVPTMNDYFDLGGNKARRKTEGISIKEVAEIMKKQGCSRGSVVDGGGTTAFWFKDKSENVFGPGRTYDGRDSGDIMYFVEQ